MSMSDGVSKFWVIPASKRPDLTVMGFKTPAEAARWMIATTVIGTPDPEDRSMREQVEQHMSELESSLDEWVSSFEPDGEQTDGM
jgi:hypothetical protein